ncbi:AraC family transcriptional regulator [Hoeflea marina]|uniref:AraC family transcriptional regulator n=1 Tax=Hoeflea marina TaxID=274592 RepID=A0A317PHI7_9HYPH|nr:AraC family transcriptional regulator [Hoeflea marina]PWV95366.1 AraC family transcriptional regulator [Hoeflea marina]
MDSNLVDRLRVAASLASSIAHYASSRGIDVAPIARACGLDPDEFGKLGVMISLDRLCRLLEALAMLANDPQFGLKAGLAFEKGASGPFGYALMHAPTLRDALVFMGRNLTKISQTSGCTLEIGPREARLEWTFSPLILKRDQYVDMSVVMALARFRGILGQDMDRARLELEREKPTNVYIYRESLCRNLVFGAPINALVFPSELLSRANANADARLFAIMSQQMDAVPVQRPQSEDLMTMVRLHIIDSIGTRPPSLSTTAASLGLSERTLQRRLSEAGTSLKDMIDEGRRELAQRLLSETSLSLSQIGFRLGFSAPSAFTRSATRWFGVSPSAFRQRGIAQNA